MLPGMGYGMSLGIGYPGANTNGGFPTYDSSNATSIDPATVPK